MDETVCLRCEWTGKAERSNCPRCGVPLFRPASEFQQPAATSLGSLRRPEPTEAVATELNRPTEGRPGKPGVRPAETDPSLPRPADDSCVPRGRLWRTSGALAGAALFLVGVWLRSDALQPIPTPSRSPRASGRLVYAADLGPRLQRLWMLNLASGNLTRGPRIPKASELLAGWGESWIAFTSEDPDGTRVAYILQGVGPKDRPHRIAAGDVVAWDPTGVKVVAARRGSGMGVCGQAVAVTVVGAGPWGRDRVFPLQTLCRNVLSIGPAGALIYYTQASGGRANVFLVGFSASRWALRGYTLLSASPSGSLLLTGKEKGGPTELYRPGMGPPTPVGDGGRQLRVGRVLAWSPEGTKALVAGELGERRGPLLIQAAPDGGVPRLLALIDGEAAGGAFDASDTAYLVVGGRLFVVRASQPVPVPLPIGAPRPAGPIAWLP